VGTGIVGLTLGKMLESMEVEADIIATDFYPSVLANLQATNFLHPSSVLISSHFLDWSTFPILNVLPAPFDRIFYDIIGADIIYEASHALWIKACLQGIFLKAAALSVPQPIFHLVIPLRPTHAIESQTNLRRSKKSFLKYLRLLSCHAQVRKIWSLLYWRNKSLCAKLRRAGEKWKSSMGIITLDVDSYRPRTGHFPYEFEWNLSGSRRCIRAIVAWKHSLLLRRHKES
jgi:hypothetical protein